MKLDESSKEILRLGNIIIGATVGNTLSILTDDPVAQVSGSAVGAILPEVLNDFSERVLSRREKIKVGAVTQFAVEKILINLNAGKIINLEFTNSIKEEHRTSAEELYEGILIKAKNEAQEKKIKHIGAIYGNCIFVEDITSEDVNHLLSAVGGLTYRKLSIIALYGRKKEIFPEKNIMVDPYSWYPNVSFHLSTQAILQDLFELGNQGIVDLKSLLATNHLHLWPAKFELSQLGQKYFELMSLDEIPIQDLNPIIDNLEYKEYYGINTQGCINGVKP